MGVGRSPTEGIDVVMRERDTLAEELVVRDVLLGLGDSFTSEDGPRVTDATLSHHHVNALRGAASHTHRRRASWRSRRRPAALVSLALQFPLPVGSTPPSASAGWTHSTSEPPSALGTPW